MYDELHRVPLIVLNGPDNLVEAKEEMVSLLDIPPLIHHALDIDLPEVYEGQIPGVDTARNVVLAEHEVECDVVVGARSRNWLYRVDEILDEQRLYDLRNGSFERVDPKDGDSNAT